MGKGATKYKSMTIAKQPQELGRLRVIGGPDAGSLFIITSSRISIGRGDENEIAIMDLKMSRRHAEITKGPTGYLIQDLGGANGMAINGHPTKQWVLKSGDKIGLGSSVLEFFSSDSPQLSLVQPEAVSKQVGTGQSGLTKFIKLPQANLPKAASSQQRKGEEGLFERNKKFVLVLTGLVALAALLPQAEMQVRKRRPRYQPPSELSPGASALRNFLPQVGDPEIKKKADAYFKEGYREYVEKNYLRAKADFEIAKQIDPDHEMAARYIDNVDKSMKKEAEDHKKAAKIDEAANRKKSALNHYDAIRRLYFRDQSNAIYKEADVAYKELEKSFKEGATR